MQNSKRTKSDFQIIRNCYFRARKYNTRLSFNSGNTEARTVLNGIMLIANPLRKRLNSF